MWVLVATAGCGHLGVDLNGQDASVTFEEGGVDASRTDTKTDKSSETGKSSTDDKSTKDYTSETGTDSIGLSGLHPNEDAGDATFGGVDASLDAALDAGVDADVDANVDASELDAGGMDADVGVQDAGPTDDGGIDTSDSTTVPIVDDNAYTCDPLCECAALQTCDLDCKLPECKATCDVDASCKVNTGPATTVTVECAAGSTCDAGGAAPVVHAICKGEGDCQIACGQDQKCDVDCLGTGTCTAVCIGNSVCHVNCGADSHCYLNQPEGALGELICPVETVACSSLLSTCNGECPDDD